jgi:uncharacterized damage-inducible protein DinB
LSDTPILANKSLKYASIADPVTPRALATSTGWSRCTTVYDLVLYAIDNEIHHRGRGYVYLRALGIEPPPLYERE